MTTGEKIRSMRKEMGLTQYELSNLVGLSNEYISVFETDRREPSVQIAKSLCDVFGVSLDWLYGFDNHEPNANGQRVLVKVWCPECKDWHGVEIETKKLCANSRKNKKVQLK